MALGRFQGSFPHDVAYGVGDGLALRKGLQAARAPYWELVRRYYGWGFIGHWDGHAAFVNYRIILVTAALHWAMDTRDSQQPMTIFKRSCSKVLAARTASPMRTSQGA